MDAKGVIVARHNGALANRGQTKTAPTSMETIRIKALSIMTPKPDREVSDKRAQFHLFAKSAQAVCGLIRTRDGVTPYDVKYRQRHPVESRTRAQSSDQDFQPWKAGQGPALGQQNRDLVHFDYDSRHESPWDVISGARCDLKPGWRRLGAKAPDHQCINDTDSNGSSYPPRILALPK
jgi:hypothetical protein